MTVKNFNRRMSLALMGVALAVFCQPTGAQENYKIGVMLDVTGGASFPGKPEQNAVQLAVDEINQAGGIRGRKVEILFPWRITWENCRRTSADR
jgi:branched-chain amino acid transport system substrate-binding protein